MTYRPGETDWNSDWIQRRLCRRVVDITCNRYRRGRITVSSERRISDVLEVYRVVVIHRGESYAERARLIGSDVGRVVAQTDAEESSTRARTAAADVAVWCAPAAVAVSGATFVVVVAPHTNLKLARSCDLVAQRTRKC